jgi:Zn-dependent M28 family amino/carboxypeptidase
MAFITSADQLPDLLGITRQKLDKAYQKSQSSSKSHFKKLNHQVRIKIEKVSERFETENVLGLVEGSDKKEELIVITAHYDHVGKSGDQIYNGADDDGSGPAAVMELAQAFTLAKKEGNGPRRSILFMTVTGEEKGLLGSEFYSSNPVWPLEQTVANLNIDMIGRVDPEHENMDEYIYIIGSDHLSHDLHTINEEVNKLYTGLKLDYKYNDTEDPNRFYYRSDHYNFAKHNIPIIFYFNGTHKDYHQPTDTIEKIRFDLLKKRSDLVFYCAWELANREHRIRLND